MLNRTYGGAVRSLSTEPSITERHTLSVAERERIAKAAGPFLKDARVLMIGSGSTIVHVARRIAVDMKNITVICLNQRLGAVQPARLRQRRGWRSGARSVRRWISPRCLSENIIGPMT